MTQPDLFNGPALDVRALNQAARLARRTDPATSHAAAVEVRRFAPRHHDVILRALQEHGPLNRDGIARVTHLTAYAVSKRTSELQRMGLVRIAGKAPGVSGRDQQVLEAL